MSSINQALSERSGVIDNYTGTRAHSSRIGIEQERGTVTQEEGDSLMVRFERGLGVGMGVVLPALTALCPISYADEVDATGQGACLGVSAQRISDEWRQRGDCGAEGVMLVGLASS